MRRLLQLLHHRSLTVAIIALFLGFYAFAFLPEHSYRLHRKVRHFSPRLGSQRRSAYSGASLRS